jgi:lycopene beta-cyclase
MQLDFDYILVGGGLQNALIALGLLEAHPTLRLALVERQDRLGGNHTWCFHAQDIPADARPWVEDLIVRRWPAYEVAFPDFRRTIFQPYSAVTSERLDAVLCRRLEASSGCLLLKSSTATSISPTSVVLQDGQTLTALTVIESPGPLPPASCDLSGFQKFVGLELELKAPSGKTIPVLMDARVEQTDGYHFMYVLPFSPTRFLVEDTVFSEDPRLDREGMRAAVLGYLSAHGLEPKHIHREEEGVLPMPWLGCEPTPSPRSPLVAGIRGGWFHPGTGYSFPVAIRLARVISRRAPGSPWGPELESLSRHVLEQRRFIRFLNRIFFRGVKPEERWRIIARFYRLPEELVSRYYALELTRVDRARILFGRPPWTAFRRPTLSTFTEQR